MSFPTRAKIDEVVKKTQAQETTARELSVLEKAYRAWVAGDLRVVLEWTDRPVHRSYTTELDKSTWALTDKDLLGQIMGQSLREYINKLAQSLGIE